MEITLDVFFKIFFVCITVDFFTGVLVAAKQGRLKSRTCSNGLFRSIGECIVLTMLMIINYYIPSLGSIIKTFIIGFIFKEGLSIVENLVQLDVWIPQAITKAFEVGKDKVDKGEK